MSERIYCQRCGTRCEEFIDGGIKRKICPNCGFIYYKNPYPCLTAGMR